MDEDAGKRFLCDRQGYKLLRFYNMVPWHSCDEYLRREETRLPSEDKDSRKAKILMEKGEPVTTGKDKKQHPEGCSCGARQLPLPDTIRRWRKAGGKKAICCRSGCPVEINWAFRTGNKARWPDCEEDRAWAKSCMALYKSWGADKDNNWMPEHSVVIQMEEHTMEEAATRGDVNNIACTSINPHYNTERRWGANIYQMEPSELEDYFDQYPCDPATGRAMPRELEKLANTKGYRDFQHVLEVATDNIKAVHLPPYGEDIRFVLREQPISPHQQEDINGPGGTYREVFMGDDHPMLGILVPRDQDPKRKVYAYFGPEARPFIKWQGDWPRGLNAQNGSTVYQEDGMAGFPPNGPQDLKSDGRPKKRELFLSRPADSPGDCGTFPNTNCWACWKTKCERCKELYTQGHTTWGEAGCDACPDWFRSEWTVMGHNAKFEWLISGTGPEASVDPNQSMWVLVYERLDEISSPTIRRNVYNKIDAEKRRSAKDKQESARPPNINILEASLQAAGLVDKTPGSTQAHSEDTEEDKQPEEMDTSGADRKGEPQKQTGETSSLAETADPGSVRTGSAVKAAADAPAEWDQENFKKHYEKTTIEQLELSNYRFWLHRDWNQGVKNWGWKIKDDGMPYDAEDNRLSQGILGNDFWGREESPPVKQMEPGFYRESTTDASGLGQTTGPDGPLLLAGACATIIEGNKPINTEMGSDDAPCGEDWAVLRGPTSPRTASLIEFVIKEEERRELEGERPEGTPRQQQRKGGKPSIKEYAKALSNKKPKQDGERMPPPKTARKEGERKPPTKRQKPRQDSPRPVMEERRVVYRVQSPPPRIVREERRYGNQERRYTPYPPRMYGQNQWGRYRGNENDREGHLNRKFHMKPPRTQRRR